MFLTSMPKRYTS